LANFYIERRKFFVRQDFDRYFRVTQTFGTKAGEVIKAIDMQIADTLKIDVSLFFESLKSLSPENREELKQLTINSLSDSK
jgi:hypothetical protein